MCGINGIFVFRPSSVTIDVRELERTRDHMIARGPDGKGVWVSPDCRVGLGHRRLAIVDLTETGAQPMSSADGRYVVTFTGEIYNYPALRVELESQGAIFRSHSDTEALLHLYARDGEAMVSRLRGMFAFAIHDAARDSLFLARDPFGIKPLYYACDGATFRFASQVKALVAGGAVSREPDPAGYAGFCLWGSVPEPFTVYRDIHLLPAGCAMTVGANGPSAPLRYHSVAALHAKDTREAMSLTAGERLERAHAAMRDSVRHHLMSDVPVGAFLSSGIDSGALVGLMRDAGQAEIETVTLAFEEFRGGEDDESPLAAKVASNYGTRHTTRFVTRAEFEADLPHILEAMDQPSIDGINSWFVSKAASERGLKVAISGLGGDELLGGYPSFRDIPRWVARFGALSRAPLLGVMVRQALRLAGVERFAGSAKAAGVLEYGGTFAGAYYLRRGLFMPWELDAALGRDMARAGLETLGVLTGAKAALQPEPTTDFGKVATLETSLYMRNQLLRDTDWASMAHSLEVRVPLVDSVLHEIVAPLVAAGLPAGGKRALASAPSKPLPVEVTSRRKTGFGVPVGEWILRARDGAASTARPPSKGSASRDWSKALIGETLKQAHP